MGKTNSKAVTRSSPSLTSIMATFDFKKESFLKKIYANEKRMIIYNCCPKELTRTKISKRFGRLIKNRRYFIKSVKLDSSSLDLKNLELLRIIPRLKNLSSLDIEFWGHNNTSLKSFIVLSKAVAFLKRLKSCVVTNCDPDFGSLKGSSMVMHSLFLLQKIETVNFTCTNWMHNNVNEQAIKTFLSNDFLPLRTKRFDLDLSSCEYLTDQALTCLGIKLSSFWKLKNLRLDLSYVSTISKIGIKSLFRNLSRLPLVNLELNFGGNNTISDRELVIISQQLRKINTLHSLILTFKGFNNIQQAGFCSLFDSINQLEKLESLTIDLSGCQGLMDYEMIQISQRVELFGHLTYLKLDFTNCCLNDIGIIHFAQSFEKLVKLKSLSLSFGGYENIMDHALIVLGQALSKLKDLTFLKFHFLKTNVTDYGLEKFTQNIWKLHALKQLDLSFKMSKKITVKGWNLVWDLMSKFPDYGEERSEV